MPGADAAVEIRDHAAAMVGDDLDAGMAVEQAGEHQPAIATEVS